MTASAWREWRGVVDREGWGAGPWDSEPDKAQWVDVETELPCLIVRHSSMGNLCGYVGVAQKHPLYGRHWEDDAVALSAHGGVNYSAPCQEDANAGSGICHVPEPGEPDDVWWFGFACSSLWDYQPAMMARLRELPSTVFEPYPPYDHEAAVAAASTRMGGGWPGTAVHPFDGSVYRTVGYVRTECENLAQQLARVT